VTTIGPLLHRRRVSEHRNPQAKLRHALQESQHRAVVLWDERIERVEAGSARDQIPCDKARKARGDERVPRHSASAWLIVDSRLDACGDGDIHSLCSSFLHGKPDTPPMANESPCLKIASMSARLHQNDPSG
jgi:hypothetical protein